MKLCAKFILFACVSIFMTSGIVSHPADAASKVVADDGNTYYFNEDNVVEHTSKNTTFHVTGSATPLLSPIDPLVSLTDVFPEAKQNDVKDMIEKVVKALAGVSILLIVGAAILRALRINI